MAPPAMREPPPRCASSPALLAIETQFLPRPTAQFNRTRQSPIPSIASFLQCGAIPVPFPQSQSPRNLHYRNSPACTESLAPSGPSSILRSWIQFIAIIIAVFFISIVVVFVLWVSQLGFPSRARLRSFLRCRRVCFRVGGLVFSGVNGSDCLRVI